MPPHNLRNSLLVLPERRLLPRFPPAYNIEASPYESINDFSKVTRAEVKIQHKIKARPCKVIFVGDMSVGKTTIVSRFCYDKFQWSYKATIGVDFEIQNFDILGHDFCLEVWDTAGQERFKCIAQAYYRNAKVIVIVFDMTKLNTLHSTTNWLKSSLKANSIQKPLIFLVGTKSDLLSQAEFMQVERVAIEVAISLQAEYWSVSARTGFKIVELFQRIAALAFESTIIERYYTSNKVLGVQQQYQHEKPSTLDFRTNMMPPTKNNRQSKCIC